MNNGQYIKFWNDIWCGETSFEISVSAVFAMDRVQNACIFYYYQILGGRVVWVLNFQEIFGMNQRIKFNCLQSLRQSLFLWINKMAFKFKGGFLGS